MDDFTKKALQEAMRHYPEAIPGLAFFVVASGLSSIHPSEAEKERITEIIRKRFENVEEKN